MKKVQRTRLKSSQINKTTIIQDVINQWKENKTIENWEEEESKFAWKKEEKKKIEEMRQ